MGDMEKKEMYIELPEGKVDQIQPTMAKGMGGNTLMIKENGILKAHLNKGKVTIIHYIIRRQQVILIFLSLKKLKQLLLKKVAVNHLHKAKTMINDKIYTINSVINKDLWCDFEIEEFDGFKMVLICGVDLPHNWLLRITFERVSFILMKSFWKKHNSLPPIELWSNKEAFDINLFNGIEVGNVLFKFNHGDNNNDNTNAYIIASNDLEFSINPKYANRLE
jgi:hypothetical protein